MFLARHACTSALTVGPVTRPDCSTTWVSVSSKHAGCIGTWLTIVDIFTVIAEKPPSSGHDSVRRLSGDVEKQPHRLSGDHHAPYLDPAVMDSDYEGKPTEEELAVLRRVPGTIPIIAYLICIVEFCERASYYGVQPLISNFVNRPLPRGGNGWGAPPAGDQQTAGALGMGTVVANAVTQSFSMLAYALPLLFGWLADARTGRFKLICWGVGVFGVAHVLMVAAGSKDLLENGTAKAPYFISVYILSIGAGEFPALSAPGSAG